MAVEEEDDRVWLVIDDSALIAGLDQLAAYIDEHGSFEWTDPKLSPEAAAEARWLAERALQRLRERS